MLDNCQAVDGHLEWLSLFNMNLQSLAHLPPWGQLYKASAGLLSFSLRLILLGAVLGMPGPKRTAFRHPGVEEG